MGDVLNFKYNCVPMSIFAPPPPLSASNTYEIMCMQLATKGLDSAEHNRPEVPDITDTFNLLKT